MPNIKSTEIANRLKVSDSTIRLWADRYKEFLSVTGRGLKVGATRVFTPEDQDVLATVAKLVEAGVPHADITDELRQGTRVEAPSETVKNDRAIIPVNVLVELRSLESKLQDREQELEALREQNAADRERITELSAKTAGLETEIRLLRERLDEEKARKRGLFG